MKNKTREQHKGIIFAGCSFTWGQGLYYYSNLPSLTDDSQNSWNGDVVTFSQIEFMKTIRYPRLVASSLKTFEVCQTNNGGSNPSIMDFWNRTFTPTQDAYFNSYAFGHQRYFYKDFQYIIYQITNWARSPSILTNLEYNLQGTTCHNDLDNKNFKKLLSDNNLTLDQYCDRAIKSDLGRIKSFLQNFENNGVKPLVMTWPDDVVPYIKNDPWYLKRFITHEYKNNTYDSIQHLMNDNPHLQIDNDDYFDKKYHDAHPSRECHRILANSVLKKIRNFNE